MSEKTVPPIYWIIAGGFAFLFVIIFLLDFFYEVKIGKLAGLVIANIVKAVSPVMGAALIYVVNTFVWF